MKGFRIGLDIDDCVAGFWDSYCEYFDTNSNPHMLEDHIITQNVANILKHDRNFWLNLPVINMPDFVPELYCTKRVNNKIWTKKWLELNGLPNRPVYQMLYQHGNKATMIRGRVDVFVDDSWRNVEALNKAGVPSLLYHTERNVDNPMYKVYELSKEAIIEAYVFMKKYGN